MSVQSALSAPAARMWCHALSRTLQVQRIEPNGKPYLERYFAAGWSPTNRRSGPAIFLHHFVASDPDDAVHSHPWGWSLSLILAGGYREERCNPDGTVAIREYRGRRQASDRPARSRLLVSLPSWALREGVEFRAEV